MEKINFVSNTKNPYAMLTKVEKDNSNSPEPGCFVSNVNANVIHQFNNCTANVTGRKIVFTHV